MFTCLKRHRVICYIICFIMLYIANSNVFANTYYHLKANEKVEKIVISTPLRQEIYITSEDIIDNINRQFHMQLFFSLGIGNIRNDINESFNVTFYNERDKEIMNFKYNFKNKKIYPGELNLPKDTEEVMDELVSQKQRT